MFGSVGAGGVRARGVFELGLRHGIMTPYSGPWRQVAFMWREFALDAYFFFLISEFFDWTEK